MGKRLPRWRPAHLAKKLRQIRYSLELSQDGMLGALGLDDRYRSKISRYEMTGDPELPVLLKYARLARVSTDDLIDDDVELPKRIQRAAERGEQIVSKNRRSRST